MASEGSVPSPMPTTEIEAAKHDGEDWASVYAMQLATMSTLPMVLNAAIQLQVFEILGKAGPEAQLSASEIVSRIPGGAHLNPDAPSMLDRMLRLLVGYSVLTCSLAGEDGDGQIAHYCLSPVGKFFVSNEDGASLAPLVALVQDKVQIDSWYELRNAVIEGGVPFDRVHGVHSFEYPGTDPRFNEVFNKAMIGQTTFLMKQILQQYKRFEQLKTLVDVGGGLGVALKMIISKYPHIKGINYDLPHVIQHALPYSGMEHVGGDMFESVPQGDAIFMKWMLHDWSDGHCLKLLKNCYKALPEEGKVIVVDAILLPLKPETNTSFICSSQMDTIMLTQNPGGKERSEKQFLALATEAGFRGVNICWSGSNFWLMEFYK